MKDWEKRKKIEDILDKNIKEIPYEGTFVDQQSIVDDFMILIKEIENDK